MSYWKSARNFQNTKFRAEIKRIKFGTKNVLIWYFLTEIWIKLLPCSKSTHLNLGKCLCKKKTFQICDQKRFIWVFLCCDFEKTIVLYGIKQNKTFQTLVPKLPYFGIFRMKFEKKNCHVSKKHPLIFQSANFLVKQRVFTCGTKKTFFGYFWTIILRKLLSYLNSAPSNLLKRKASG